MSSSSLNWPLSCDEWDLQASFGHSGGLIGANTLSLLMREQCEQPISVLARHIVDRDVVHIDSNADVMLPMFQFDPVTLHVRQAVKMVIDTLKPVFDDVELAHWFAEPNAWLEWSRPADVIVENPLRVLEAARADRFVAAGD